MGKKGKKKDRKRGGGAGKPAAHPEPGSAHATTPSAPTFFRFKVLDASARDLIAKVLVALEPLRKAQDAEKIEQIQAAGTAEELLDLVPMATGLGEGVWAERMRHLGPEVASLIAERLKAARNIRDSHTREITYERLIEELRWRGDSGAEALMESFDSLHDYAKGLASVVLGLLGARAAADRLWDFYQRVVGNRGETYFVGALYGLVDLKDPRALDALIDLLMKGRLFQELFGLIWLAGDRRAIAPLMAASMGLPEEWKTEVLTALVGIAHRLGREVLVDELTRISAGKESRQQIEAVADKVLSAPAGRAEEFFASFRRGPRTEDFMQAFRTLSRG